MKAKDLEKQMTKKGLNAPRLAPSDIKKTIKSATYTILPDKKTTVCQINLINGFSTIGLSKPVSIENFDEDIGKQLSYEHAVNKIWELEGYLLQQKLYENNI